MGLCEFEPTVLCMPEPHNETLAQERRLRNNKAATVLEEYLSCGVQTQSRGQSIGMMNDAEGYPKTSQTAPAGEAPMYVWDMCIYQQL